MLRPNYNTDIPELTIEIAQAAFPKGNVLMKIRDEMGPIFEDEEFEELYPRLGQPAVSPGRLAMATVMQYMENLTDRQAADAVRGRIDWKYVLGLELTDAGFDYSVLSEFRGRLVEGEAEQMLLDIILERCKAKGLLAGKSKQRSDSTHVLAVIRHLNRIELAGETMRRTLNKLAQIAPEWLKTTIQPEWGQRYGKPLDNYRLPKSKAGQLVLVQAIGEDGYELLSAIYAEDAPAELQELPVVDTLRRIWVQQYYIEEEKIQWRTKEKWGQPPSNRMIASPDELDARYAAKDSTTWKGYKVHFTETCMPDQPRLITQVETTPATTPDVKATSKIHEDLAARDLLPDEHLVDGGYIEINLLVNSQKKGIDLIGPVHVDRSWQATTDGAFDHTQFGIAWEAMQATCPQGKNSVYWKQGKTRRGDPNIHFIFSDNECAACQSRSQCTRAKVKGRMLTVFPQEIYQALEQARRRQKTEDFKTLYNARSGIEGTISQAVNAIGVRHARYRGLARTHLQHLATAAAINLIRAARWLMGYRPEKTRISHFAALALQL